VIATGSDGYTSVYSLGEIDPQFGNQQILIASSDTEDNSVSPAPTG